MPITEKDRTILRGLADKRAAIAADPVNSSRASEWKRMNDLTPGRPMVWINEIPWHEMDYEGELTLQCEDPLCKNLERRFRLEAYQWNHMPGDMVISKTFASPMAIRSTGFGISEDVEIVRTDDNNSVVSRDYHQQINDESDIEKIKTPEITHNAEASEKNLETIRDLFGDILPVEKRGVVHSWFAPWDELIRWWDVEAAMLDLALRPELVHMAMSRLTDAYVSMLDQWEESNLLSVDDGNHRVGSGGYAYTDSLPGEHFDPDYVRPYNQWGCATAQIFSDVSPEMHMEFALQYEKKWLDRFGITYYGCCEPLHNKMGILESIPNLRKISMSPWANVEKMVSLNNNRYVLSHKPNPAVLATDKWNPALARKNLEDVLEKTRGCAIEVIMKDISTVRYEPRRLWEWAKIAAEVADKYAD